MLCTNCDGSEDRRNIDPELWGRSTWTFLWASALSYPANPSYETQQAYTAFLKNLYVYLPCFNCRSHCKEEFQDEDFHVAVKNNMNYQNRILQLYNSVATRLGKQKLATADEATAFLLKKRQQRFCPDPFAIFLIGTIVVLLVAVLIKK